MRSLVLAAAVLAASAQLTVAKAESYTPLQLELFLSAACPGLDKLSVDQNGEPHWWFSPLSDNYAEEAACVVRAQAQLARGFPNNSPAQTNRVDILQNGKIAIGYE